MTAPCLMVQGTASGVGKTLLTAALCRIFSRRGYRVAPFKAQNMALNAAVTADGREIGRAQAAQADAAGVEPTVDMNPILMKPEGDDRSQIVVRGVPLGRLTFEEYGAHRDELLGVVAESLARLRGAHDLVIIEGAGSPAEINLSAGDIVNMRIARLADAPVLLVGDIDRGGVFAAFVGTLALLQPDDRARVAGFVVNKFRGNLALLAPGLHTLHERTGVPVLGVVPYLERGLVPAEDSLDLDDTAPPPGDERLAIVVVRPPRIANFDDLEPLAREPGVHVRFATSPSHLVGADLLIVPGSKSTMADLAWLRERGVADALISAVRAGTPLIGLCGGYQMLGHACAGASSPTSDRSRPLGVKPSRATRSTWEGRASRAPPLRSGSSTAGASPAATATARSPSMVRWSAPTCMASLPTTGCAARCSAGWRRERAWPPIRAGAMAKARRRATTVWPTRSPPPSI